MRGWSLCSGGVIILKGLYMVDINILEPILSKVEKVTDKKYLTARGRPLIFRHLNQLQIIYIALAEYAPNLKNRDVNKDKNHNKRIKVEIDRVTPAAEFLASTPKQKDDLINSMIKTRTEALNYHIQNLKEMCSNLGYTKKQIESTIPFLRDAMVLIAENKIDLKQELFVLNTIIKKKLFNKDFLDDDGTLIINSSNNDGWL